MKKACLFFILLVFTSCSGFFDQGLSERDGIGMNPLALSDGSGYLSTDKYNEITPFVFNDTNTGKKWLFFASDREGSYDIYYSEIDKNGKCSRPVKMTNAINDSGDQHSPVVFYGQYNESSYGYFLIYANGFSGMVIYYIYLLNADFSVNQFVTDPEYGGITRLSLKNKMSTSPTLLMSIGDTQWIEMEWNAASFGQFYTPNNYTLSNVSMPLHSVDGYYEKAGVEYDIYWYVFSAMINGKQQIYAGAYDTDDAYNFYPVVPYASKFNDKDPVIDETDSKVYFASDRYGKGNYDLYRYNLVRYDMCAAKLLERPTLNSLTGDPGVNVYVSWQPVSGAAYYRIFRSNDDSTYTLITTVSTTDYLDADITYDIYYYKVQAVFDLGVSGLSYSQYIDYMM